MSPRQSAGGRKGTVLYTRTEVSAYLTIRNLSHGGAHRRAASSASIPRATVRRAPSDDDLYRLASECRAVAPPAPRGADALATLSAATAGTLAALGERVDGALGTERPGRRAPGSLRAPAPGGALATAAVGGGPEAAALGGALETTTAAVGATTEFLADGLFAIGDGLMGLGLGVPGTGRRHRRGSLEAQVDEAKRAAALARGRCSTLEYHVDEAHHMAPLARVPAGAA